MLLDDLSSGRAGRLDPQVTLHKLSITDAAALTSAVTALRPELIYHLAAQIDVRVSVDAPAEDLVQRPGAVPAAQQLGAHLGRRPAGLGEELTHQDAEHGGHVEPSLGGVTQQGHQVAEALDEGRRGAHAAVLRCWEGGEQIQS